MVMDSMVAAAALYGCGAAQTLKSSVNVSQSQSL